MSVTESCHIFSNDLQVRWSKMDCEVEFTAFNEWTVRIRLWWFWFGCVFRCHCQRVRSLQVHLSLCKAHWSKIKQSGGPWPQKHPCTFAPLFHALCTCLLGQTVALLCMFVCLMCKRRTAQTILQSCFSPECVKRDTFGGNVRLKRWEKGQYLFIDCFSMLLCFSTQTLFKMREVNTNGWF